MNRILTLLTLLCIALPLQAADDIYDIEMVIFAQPFPPGNEFWPEQPGEPDITAALGSLSEPTPPAGIEYLARDALQLAPMATTLNRRGATVHAHIGWRQHVGARENREWYWIGDARLHGVVRITRGRFLHIDADLVLTNPATGQNYRAVLHRRMRSNELNYIDHPKIGMLIRADRFEASTEGGELPEPAPDQQPLSAPAPR